jgi:tryptophan-rich sensory protein
VTENETDQQVDATDELEKGWFDEPKNVDKIVWTLVALCVASVAADLFYDKDKHSHYWFQEWIGFDALYGFVSCVLLVLAAKQLRKILMRGEDYYD